MPAKKRVIGFTLVELLVVIAIIALLMAIMMPALRAAKRLAKGTRCNTNLRQTGIAMLLYADDWDNKVPRDETDGFWAVLFMPYVGESIKTGISNYYDLGIYQCPSYPVKEQTVDYVLNVFDLKDTAGPNTEQRGASRLDDFPRHGSTIYMADYEYLSDPGWGHIQIIRKRDNVAVLKSKLKWLDVYHRQHLPIYGDGSGRGRRVARDRHGKEVVNCLFVDGHASKMDSMELTPYDFGRPASEK